MQLQQITKQQHIYGLGIAYETLNSKVNIDTVTVDGFISHIYPAWGKTILKNSYLLLNPFVGQRYHINKITLDFLVGLDIAFCLKSHEIAKVAISQDGYRNFENDKEKPAADYRTRLQIKAQYERIGLLAGYSFGLTNYQHLSATKAYSDLFRLGISYRIR